MNIIAAILAAVDKSRARRRAWRISEATLLLFGFFGGALLEWIVMLKIRHKTKHKRFMILLPLFVLLHIALIILALWLWLR